MEGEGEVRDSEGLISIASHSRIDCLRGIALLREVEDRGSPDWLKNHWPRGQSSGRQYSGVVVESGCLFSHDRHIFTHSGWCQHTSIITIAYIDRRRCRNTHRCILEARNILAADDSVLPCIDQIGHSLRSRRVLSDWGALMRLVPVGNRVDSAHSFNALQFLWHVPIAVLLYEVVEFGNRLRKLQFRVISVEVGAHRRYPLW